MQGLWPQKTISLSGLAHVGENVYSMDGKEVTASCVFTDAYDRMHSLFYQSWQSPESH